MASDLTPERVRALLEEATPGPWRWAHHGTHEVEAAPNQRIADCGTIGHAMGDARLMARAPDIARALLAAWEERDRLAHELAAYKRAKAENDERFMLEREEARIERDKARAVAAAARRLVAGPAAGAYTPWESAGGPNECEHGVARSLACRACDLAVVMAGAKAPPEPPATTTHSAEDQGWTWSSVPVLAPRATAQDTSAAEPTTLPGWRWMAGMRALTDHRGAHGAPYRLWTGNHGMLRGEGEGDASGYVGGWESMAELLGAVPDPTDPATGGCLLALLGPDVAVTISARETGPLYRIGYGLDGRRHATTGHDSLGAACIAVAVAMGRWPGGAP